jgi:GTPase SAR1 family protein
MDSCQICNVYLPCDQRRCAARPDDIRSYQHYPMILGAVLALMGNTHVITSFVVDPRLRKLTVSSLLVWAAFVECIFCVCLLAQELSFRIPNEPCLPEKDVNADNILDYEDCESTRSIFHSWRDWPTWEAVEEAADSERIMQLDGGGGHFGGQRGGAINWCRHVSFVFQLAWIASTSFYAMISLDLLLDLVSSPFREERRRWRLYHGWTWGVSVTSAVLLLWSGDWGVSAESVLEDFCWNVNFGRKGITNDETSNWPVAQQVSYYLPMVYLGLSFLIVTFTRLKIALAGQQLGALREGVRSRVAFFLSLWWLLLYYCYQQVVLNAQPSITKSILMKDGPIGYDYTTWDAYIVAAFAFVVGAKSLVIFLVWCLVVVPHHGSVASVSQHRQFSTELGATEALINGQTEDQVPRAIRELGAGVTGFYTSLLQRRRKLRRNKVMLVGPGRVGKTSLLRRLTRQTFRPEEESTRGIAACAVDVTTWALSNPVFQDATTYEAAVAAEVAQQLSAAEPSVDVHTEPSPATPAKSNTRCWCGVLLLCGVVVLTWGAYMGFTANSVDLNSPCELECKHGTCVQAQRLPTDQTTAATCMCTGDYFGPLCDRNCSYPAPKDCGSHGNCEKGRCICTKNFTGASCQTHSGVAAPAAAAAPPPTPPPTPPPAPELVILGVSVNYVAWFNLVAVLLSLVVLFASYRSFLKMEAEGVLTSDVDGVVGRVVDRLRDGRAAEDDAPQAVFMDFAGQEMYYLMHHIFISEELSIYLVLFSLADSPGALVDEAAADDNFAMNQLENIHFWLNSIHAQAPNAPIIVVGSKTDLVDEQTRSARVAAMEQTFVGAAFERQLVRSAGGGGVVISVDNSQSIDEGVALVRQHLLAVTDSLPGYGDDVPLSWLKFLDLAAERQAGGQSHMSLADARDLAVRCHVGVLDTNPDQELLLLLHLMTSFGLLMHFDELGLRELVILDVQWLLNVMAAMLCRRRLAERLDLRLELATLQLSELQKRARANGVHERSVEEALDTDAPKAALVELVVAQQSSEIASSSLQPEWRRLAERGRLDCAVLPELWPQLRPETRNEVLAYMVKFDLCCQVPLETGTYVVPPLLPAHPATRSASGWIDSSDDATAVLKFIHADGEWGEARGFLPRSLFYSLVANLLTHGRDTKRAMEHLYSDQMCFYGDVAYMLQHNPSGAQLLLTVRVEHETSPMVVAARVLSALEHGLATRYGVRYRLELPCPGDGCSGSIVVEECSPRCESCTNLQSAVTHPWVGEVRATNTVSQLRRSIANLKPADEEREISTTNAASSPFTLTERDVALCIIGAGVVAAAFWVESLAGSLAGPLVLVCGGSAIAGFPVSKAIIARLDADTILLTNEDLTTGPLGLCGFALGIVDIATALYFSAKLVIFEPSELGYDEQGRQYASVLSACCLLTLVSTMIVTGWMQMKVLHNMARAPAASEWLQSERAVVAAVCVLSLTRLENLRVIKTDVYGRSVLSFPFEQKHFQFCQSSSWYHHVIEDFPRVCISLAALLGKNAHDPLASVLLMICSIFSLLFGIFKHLVVKTTT